MARILFVADPPEALNPAGDTSLALAAGALELGHSVTWSTPQHVSLQGFRPGVDGCVMLEECTDTPLGPQPIWSAPQAELQALRSFDTVFIRKDPPFDQAYTSFCWLLQLEDKARYVNPPASLLSLHEKTVQFSALSAGVLGEHEVIPAVVSRSLAAVSAVLDSWLSQGHQHGFILKPWLGYGGRGVHFCATAEETLDVYEAENQSGLVMVQPFEPAVLTAGDVRVIIARDRILGCFARKPAAGKVASNLAQGGSAHPHTLTHAQRSTIERVIPFLLNNGILFSGLDMIGDRINEINITSPTGLRTLQNMGQPDVHRKAFSLLFKDR